MDVVRNRVDGQRRRFQIRENAAGVAVQFLAHRVFQHRTPFLGAEDEVNQILGERLGHVFEFYPRPFRALAILVGVFPGRRSQARLPWAGTLQPFGLNFGGSSKKRNLQPLERWQYPQAWLPLVCSFRPSPPAIKFARRAACKAAGESAQGKRSAALGLRHNKTRAPCRGAGWAGAIPTRPVPRLSFRNLVFIARAVFSFPPSPSPPCPGRPCSGQGLRQCASTENGGSRVRANPRGPARRGEWHGDRRASCGG